MIRMLFIISIFLLNSCASLQSRDTTDAEIHRREPSLVVLVVLDQFGWWAFQRYLPYLEDGGILKQLHDNGEVNKVSYSYSTTMTANGHAAISTGTVPRVNGILGNRVFHDEHGKSLGIIDDQKHAVFGDPSSFVSASRLKVKTIAERLKEKSPNSKTVSISWKPRSAALMAGQSADLVAWFDKHSAQFTTSSYYAKQIPTWLAKWSKSHPISRYMEVWDAGNPQLYEKVNGPDHRAFEADRNNMGVTFPHDPKKAPSAAKGIELTPYSSEYLLDFSKQAVKELSLGTDSAVDLLQISISGTDAIGHAYGVESWEYFDNLLKVDRMIGKFVAWLRTRSSLSLVVTSDHGSIPFSKSQSARVDQKKLADALDMHLDSKLGQENWVLLVEHPYIYLDRKLADKFSWDRVMEQSVKFLNSQSRIHAAYDLQKLSGGPKPSTQEELGIWLGTTEASRVDLYFVPTRYVVPSASDGSTHGTPWRYDREVPLLHSGANLNSDTSYDETTTIRTLAKMIGL